MFGFCSLFAEPIEYQTHDRSINSEFKLNDFILSNFDETSWNVELRITNTSSEYFTFVKVLWVFYKNGSLVKSDYTFLECYDFENYGLTPGGFGLATTITEKADFDSIAFDVTYQSASILDGKSKNNSALKFIESKFNTLSYTDDYVEWIGSVSNQSQTPLHFPMLFCCFMDSNKIVYIDYTYIDVSDYIIQPGKTGYFNSIISPPADYDSLYFVTHYSIGITDEVVTTISAKANTLQDFTLYQNYPNPFNPETSIQFETKQPGEADLSIYNLVGKKIMTVLKEDLSPGVYTINVDMHNFPSGRYFYELKLNDYRLVKSMTLLK
jgi:hypothetical protein